MSNRPENMIPYDELDLKLGIKSSLPHVKSALALAILLWECSDRPAELQYSEESGAETRLRSDLGQQAADYYHKFRAEVGVAPYAFIAKLNNNPLLKSQLEALIVAFELVWKLAKVSFVDDAKPASAERTGGIRYAKEMLFSVNMDIIHSVIAGNEDECYRVLLAWTGLHIKFNPECERNLASLLTALSEGAVFKLTDGEKDVIFNENSVYRKLLESGAPVDVTGDREPKGSLRILRSLLSDRLNPYLNYDGTLVSAAKRERLEDYQKRVDTFLRLSSTKVIGLESVSQDVEEPDTETFDAEETLPENLDAEEPDTENNLEHSRLSGGMNALLYGVPGSGKSWTIEHEYCHEDSVVERLVFHPDYTNADFIGQILPTVDAEGQVKYEFTPGPFTSILRDAYHNPAREYILIIEEINRGNAPAIFGETFQLLDRTVEPKRINGVLYPVGTSEYGITHKDMARIIYEDPGHKVRLPSNLSIIGTMNTSDQNVFTLDTAFQRRWNMRLIENTFRHARPSLANALILDTGVTWRTFCETINALIIENKAGMASAEDKRLGVYFIHESALTFDRRAIPREGFATIRDEYDALLQAERDDSMSVEQKRRLADIRAALIRNRMFPEKVIKYLWDDAFKFNPEALFDTENMKSLEEVIRAFAFSTGSDRFSIFKPAVRASLRPDASPRQYSFFGDLFGDEV